MRDAKARTALVLMQCLCQFGQVSGYTKAIIARAGQRIETTLNLSWRRTRLPASLRSVARSSDDEKGASM